MKKSIIVLLILLHTACSPVIDINTDAHYEVVSLPDGSNVYLNHNSSISYENNFDPRTIHLEGEAFFTVVPNKSTFTVTTAHGDVEVLGTEFNVKATSDQVVVDVKKGIVSLKTAYEKSELKKGVKAIYQDGERAVQQLKSDKEYQKWVRSLEKEFKKLGKELKPILKDIGNDFKKAGKKIGDEFKK